MTDLYFSYGSYVYANQDIFQQQRLIARRFDLAVVFSKLNPTSIDLLFENGETFFDYSIQEAKTVFHILYCDPHFIIDGCSTNPGWAEARRRLT